METSTSFTSKCVIATLATVLLLGFNPNECFAARVHIHKMASVDFIATSCKATTYPSICVDSLSAYANTIQDNPLELAKTALGVSLAQARSTSAWVAGFAANGGLRAEEASAVKDCMTTMGVSVDELQKSLGAMGGAGGGKAIRGLKMYDVQTWVSAALTGDNTCMDGFPDGQARTAVREHVLYVAELTSNALALINGLGSASRP